MKDEYERGKMEKKRPVYVTEPFLPPLEEFRGYLEEIWASKWLTNNGQFHKELENHNNATIFCVLSRIFIFQIWQNETS